MKCKNCGGQIGLDMEKCPYCNSVNKVAVKRRTSLKKLYSDNEKLQNEILNKSKKDTAYSVHKRLNLILLVAGIVFWGSVFLWSNPPGGLAKIKHQIMINYYYEHAEYEQMYWYMSENQIWGGYENDDMGFIWEQYQSIIVAFAKAHETYVNEGVYDKDEVRGVIFETHMLVGMINRYEFNEKEARTINMYMDKVNMILSGPLKMTEEEVARVLNRELSDYEEIKAFAARIWEAIDER